MSRKAPLSIEEKKARMLQLLYEKREFFQLKDLEKIAPKEKGITVNSVKDVIQALVDDGVADTDKIGGSIYFWAFPSKSINAKKRKLDDLQNVFDVSSKRLKLINETIEESKNNQDNGDSSAIMKEVEALQEQKKQLQAELKFCQENDPEVLDKLKKEAQDAKEAANRWTDNIFTVKSWCKNKFLMEDKVLNKQFKIPEDLDYVE